MISPHAAVALFLTLSVAAAQTPISQIETINTTPHAGVAVADVVVPFAAGAVRAPMQLVTDQGKVCQVEPMGARWPDGSLRYLRVDMPVQVAANERRRVKLFAHTGALPNFTPDSAVVAGIAGTRMYFVVGTKRVEFLNPVLIESGNLVQVYRSRLRVPSSNLWAEMHTLVYHEVPHMRFYLRWGNSNPSTTDLSEDPGNVLFEITGATVMLDDARAKVISSHALPNNGTSVVLHQGGPIADGQAQCFEGRIHYKDDVPRVRGLAREWGSSKAFGPFGEIYPEIPFSDWDWKLLVADNVKDQKDFPWLRSVHGCNPAPTNTGAQPDFGVIVMRPDLVRSDPERLPLIARSVFQEFCRPTHHREMDVSPVLARNHPQLITRSGRPHFDLVPWIDTLGKPKRSLQDSEVAKDLDNRAFQGHDAEHWSINYLCAFAMVTGDRLARLECQHHCELWLTRFTYNTGTYNDIPGPARGIGRGFFAASWLYLVTGREDLATRVRQRIEVLRQRMFTPRTGETAALPFVVSPRYSQPIGNFWPPWEESIVAGGTAAVAEVFQSGTALMLARLVSTNVVLHGIGYTKSGWRVGYQLPFVDKNQNPYFAFADPNFEQLASGPGLTIWTMSSLFLAASDSPDPFTKRLALYILMDLFNDPKFLGEGDILSWSCVKRR